MALKTVVLVALCLCSNGLGGLVQGDLPAGAAGLERLFQDVRWIAYAPTNYDPEAHPPRFPSKNSIRADLVALRRAGFDGLVTYSATLPEIIEVAESVGFRCEISGRCSLQGNSPFDRNRRS